MAAIEYRDVYAPATYSLNILYHGEGSLPSNESASTSSNASTVYVGKRISSMIPTRAGYDFLGYAYTQDGSPVVQPNAYLSDSFSRTATSTSQNQYYEGGVLIIETTHYAQSKNSYVHLYAKWKRAGAILNTVSDTEIGSNGIAAWTKIDNAHTYKLVLSLSGAQDAEVDNIAAGSESCSFTIPSSWLNALPNSTGATATATLYTYNNGELLGSTFKSFNVAVPASVKPIISDFVADPHSDNQVVDGWDVAVQGLTYIELEVTADPGAGASLANVLFVGHGINQSSGATSGDTTIITNTGALQYTVTVTDSRGRTATQTITVTSYEYSSPVVHSLAVVRCLSDGTASDTEGNYLKALPVFVFSSVNGHNSLSVKKIEYKEHGASVWTVGVASAVSGSWSSVFGPADITKAFDVKITVTDALNNTFALEVIVQSVVGFSIGLKNDRARAGGPCQEPGFVCDWDFKLKGDFIMRSGGQSITMTFADLQALLALIQ